MNFNTIRKEYNWIEYSDQKDKNVTYVFVLNEMVGRLFGDSDILYIGKTKMPICKRYNEEINSNNTPGNTQGTNIRTTHIFKQLNLQKVKCYYTNTFIDRLSGFKMKRFLKDCQTWDKKCFLQFNENQQNQSLDVPLEKYLLIRYASEHLEVPPMNNRM